VRKGLEKLSGIFNASSRKSCKEASGLKSDDWLDAKKLSEKLYNFF
jgi:hypothetical protein